jgi:hypothetical protein
VFETSLKFLYPSYVQELSYVKKTRSEYKVSRPELEAFEYRIYIYAAEPTSLARRIYQIL